MQCVVQVAEPKPVHTPSAAELEAVPATAYPAASWDSSDKGNSGGDRRRGATNMTASERAINAAPEFPEESGLVSEELYGRPPPLHPSDSCSVAYVTPCTTGTIGPPGGEGFTQGSFTQGFTQGFTTGTMTEGASQSTAQVTVAGTSGSPFLDALVARAERGAAAPLRRNQSALPMGTAARGGGGMRRSQSANDRRGSANDRRNQRLTLTRIRSTQHTGGAIRCLHCWRPS